MILSEIKGVDKYLSNSGGLVYFKNGILYDNENIEIASFDFKNCLKIFNYFEGYVVVNARDGIGYFLDNKIAKKLPYSIENINNNVICYYRNDSNEIGIIENDEVVFKTQISSGQFYYYQKRVFDVFDNYFRHLGDKNNSLWNFDYSQLGPQPNWDDHRPDGISKFLGIQNENVFFLSQGGRVVVLDVMTGKLIKIIYSNSFPDMRDAFMHPEDKQIYCLSNWFVKVNTNRLEIESLKEIASYKKNDEEVTILYGIRSSSLQGKLISFTSFTNRRAGEAKWIGLFDYEKEEIVWHCELLQDDDGLYIPPSETPQLTNEKLCVMDSDKTLYILENPY